jgi:PD-(D/E)XK nuclease superfamily
MPRLAPPKWQARANIMNAAIDLNRGSGFVYGSTGAPPLVGARIDAHVDAALVTERATMPPRDYLGASRIGEPCARRLCYELMRVSVDDGAEFSGRMLRVFETGDRFEAMTIRWLRLAGFDLRTHKRNGEQIGFSVAGGRFRGHIDGVIVAGPDVGVEYPVLFEHKALRSASWQDIVKKGLKSAKPIYWAQVQVYMAYLSTERTLFVALDKDSQALHFELVRFDPSDAQALSDKAVDILSAVDAGELLPRIAPASDYYLCRWCPYARRCWETDR